MDMGGFAAHIHNKILLFRTRVNKKTAPPRNWRRLGYKCSNVKLVDQIL